MWHYLISTIFLKFSRDIELLFMCKCVTHCAGGCLKWSYCEFMNCPKLSQNMTMKLPGRVSYCTVSLHVWNRGFLLNVICCNRFVLLLSELSLFFAQTCQFSFLWVSTLGECLTMCFLFKLVQRWCQWTLSLHEVHSSCFAES